MKLQNLLTAPLDVLLNIGKWFLNKFKSQIRINVLSIRHFSGVIKPKLGVYQDPRYPIEDILLKFNTNGVDCFFIKIKFENTNRIYKNQTLHLPTYFDFKNISGASGYIKKWQSVKFEMDYFEVDTLSQEYWQELDEELLSTEVTLSYDKPIIRYIPVITEGIPANSNCITAKLIFNTEQFNNINFEFAFNKYRNNVSIVKRAWYKKLFSYNFRSQNIKNIRD